MAAGVTVLALLVLLAFFFAAEATADDGVPQPRIVTLTQPYWTQAVPGEIQALAIADLNGDSSGEILVVQEGGGVTVLSANSSVLPSEPITVPVSAPVSAPVVIPDAADGNLPARIALGQTILTVSVADVPTATLTVTSTTNLSWLGSIHAGTFQATQAAGSIVSPFLTADIDGDGRSEMLRVLDHVLALGAKGEEVPIQYAGNDATALTVANGKLLIGTRTGDLYDGRTGAKMWGEPLCNGKPVQSLASGDVSGNGSTEVVVGCGDYIEVREVEGKVLWRTPARAAGPIVQASVVAATKDGPAVVLLRDLRGVALLWFSNGTTDEIRLDTGGASGEKCAVAVADVNGDGFNEVVVGAGQTVWLYGYSGDELEPSWRRVLQTFEGERLSTPLAFGDLNNDSVSEWAVGSQEGYIYAYSRGTSDTCRGVPHYSWSSRRRRGV